MSDAVETLELVGMAVEALNDCMSRSDYDAAFRIWDGLWLDLRFTTPEELALAREQYNDEIKRLVATTRQQIKQKKVRGEVGPKLQSIAAKMVIMRK